MMNDQEIEDRDSNSDQNSESRPAPFKPPDGGWGWAVCATSFWANGTVASVINVFGIMFVAMMEEFDDQGGDDLYYNLSWIGSIQVATICLMSLVSSILVDTFGIQLMSGIGALIAAIGMFCSSFVYKYQVMYFTYGIMVGFGGSLLFTPSLAILNHYFKKRLGLVNGIVSLGSSVFTVILGFLLPILLDNIGLRNTMRTLSGMFLISCVCAFVWKPLIHHKDEQSTSRFQKSSKCCSRNKTSIINKAMLKNRNYLVWLCGVPLGTVSVTVAMFHMVSYTKELFPGYNADTLVVCFGAISGISRIPIGRLGDFPQIDAIWLIQLSFILTGLGITMFPFTGMFGVLVLWAGILGLGGGFFICTLGPIALDLLGAQGMGQGLGMLFAVMAIPGIASPPIAGWIRSEMGSYNIAFLLAGMTSILGSCIIFLMPRNISKERISKIPPTYDVTDYADEEGNDLELDK